MLQCFNGVVALLPAAEALSAKDQNQSLPSELSTVSGQTPADHNAAQINS